MKLVIKDDGAEARPKWGDLVGCVVATDIDTAYLVCDRDHNSVRLVGLSADVYIAGKPKDKTATCPNYYKIYRNVTITAEKD